MSTNSDISMPTQSQPVVDGSNLPTQAWWRLWFYLYQTVVGVAGQALMFLTGDQEIVGGFTVEELYLGSITGGSITPNPTDRQKQRCTNNGAFTVNATSEVGDLELRIVNGPTAGAVNFAGFSKAFTGDLMNTVNGNQFVVFIYGWGPKSAYVVKALQ